MADISIPVVWCLIHGSKPITETHKDCQYCVEALKQHKQYLPQFSIRCSFCGGPTPCLRED